MTMELFAAGFDAHNQLKVAYKEGKDVSTFTRIATGKIKVLFPGWSCTICK